MGLVYIPKEKLIPSLKFIKIKNKKMQTTGF